MTDYTDYVDEVIQAHVAIEQWFAVEEDEAALKRLLARFSPQFSMVSPLGRVLDLEALSALFRMAGGKKHGFRIELSELRGIALHERGATLSYREQQTDASGLHSDRRSTVVFEKQASGKVVWRHLQETFCSE
ncbi:MULTISPECIES: DUF4440 domain-containing protein [unclassified Pseudomonas]|uniref:DUF4440 domain-containing protein n=1 Tax=unclassified Pseudomonas TaxID=196821 RepID=UPI002AC9822F|nr:MULTISPECIES: DUF4440 domain-containing protein [unclassified Pseudomonas]MEB0044333.1 DUF4440 domain-containing protein [Pseudomonas sp. Dout3]MEB0094730.1 DUF4440 domain-containing protein [Pseudomonas sp. DC1.2]WPX59904.1 DUF4440 domain-containing protein [Pseudomonas sp. DC1.2]